MNKILVIDDEVQMCELIADILQSGQFSVQTVNDGKSGIELARKSNPDLIICDINMPGMSGFDVISEIRKIDSLQAVPFIFLTGKSDREDFRKGMNLSADDYITKPFRAVELLEAVNARFIRKRQIMLAELNQMKDLEWNMTRFLEGNSDLKIQDLESIAQKLKQEISEKKSKIQNVSFITSHLLRGSIINIISCLEFAKDKPEHYEEALKSIGQSTHSLDKLTHELNDLLSESEKNEFSLGKEIHRGKNHRSIYFVDDDEMQLKFTTHFFKKHFPELQVTTIENPLDAVNRFVQKGERPDKLFLDIFMPELDGWGVLEELKKNSIHLDITILSSSINQEDINRAGQYESVTSYLSKPITKEKIGKVLSL